MTQRLFLLFFLAFFSQSCVSLFGPKTTNLVGTWVLQSIEGQVSASDQRMVGILTLEFREDGTMKTDLPGTMEYMEGKYTIEKRMLVMTQDGSPAMARILSLKKGELWIQPIVGDEEEPYQLGFVRKM